MKKQNLFMAIALIMTLIPGVSLSAKLELTEMKKGAFKQENGKEFLQNLSGAAFDGKNIVMVDDGGISLASPVFLLGSADAKVPAPIVVSLEKNHIDLEAITWKDGKYMITTSWTDNEPLEISSRWLTELTIDEKCQCVKKQRTISLYPKAVEMLRPLYSKQAYGRVMTSDAKVGGINIEGLSYSHRENRNEVVFGFRSPLVDEKFGSPDLNPEYSLATGKAIALWVEDPMGEEPSFRTELLEMGGRGIRSMEYSETLGAYAIVAGSADRRNDYQLWLWKPDDGLLSQVPVDMNQLCRPEAISEFTLRGEPALVIISERSGSICEGAKYDYFYIPIKTDK